MNEINYRELLDFLRNKVLQSEYQDIDEIASMETRQIGDSKKRIEIYLHMLIGMARERSNTTAFAINDRLKRILRVEENETFGGIEIQLSETEADNFGISSFNLNELDEVGEFIEQLEDVLRTIRNAPESFDPGHNMGPQL